MSGESLIISEGHGVHAGEDWERSSVEREHEPHGPVLGTGRNPLGDDGDGAHRLDDLREGEPPLRSADVEKRFLENTRLRFKADSGTLLDYWRAFRRFWKHAGFEDATRRQLAGKRSRNAILAFLLEKVPAPSRRWMLAALECVWVEGVGLPFPVNRKRDLGRTLPPIGRRETPPDEDVKPWIEAVSHEADPYTRLLVLCIVQFGWRPLNQLARLRWQHVRYDGVGRPMAIVARGAEAGFKTPSDIVAHLPPDVAEALGKWKAKSPAIAPDGWIFVWRGSNGRVEASRPIDESAMRRLLRAFERKWGLKHIAPVFFRHWVKTTCRRLSDPALAALQGHKPPGDVGMRNTYDTPGIERILAEQEAEFQLGPIGVVKPPEVTVDDECREELRAVADWKAKKIGVMDLVARLEAIQRKTESVPISQ